MSLDLSKMTMAELRWYGRQLHVRGLTNYGKYTKHNRYLLEKEMQERMELSPDEIVLYDKPLRDEVRKYGITRWSVAKEFPPTRDFGHVTNSLVYVQRLGLENLLCFAQML